MEYQKFSEHTVLVVDDDLAFLKFMKHIIEQAFECKVYTAKNPKEAFDFLKKNKPSLITMDMQMPLMDGLTAIKMIRKNLSLRNTPIIACTSLSDKALLINLSKQNVSSYIVKSSEKEILLEHIEKVLKKHYTY